MSDHDDKLPDEAGISAAYRDIATEKPSRELDREVLDLAQRSARTGAKAGWLGSMIRPLAFFVTAGLSLALIVQLSNTPEFDVPGMDRASGEQPVRLPDNALRDAARETAEQIRQLETGADRSMPNENPGMTPAVDNESLEDASLIRGENDCQPAQRADSGTWWQCIRDLERRGLTGAAELELQALLEAFPQFSAPEPERR